MSMKAYVLSTEPVPVTALALLRARSAPGWVIEARSRRVLAANTAGLAELGLTRDGANALLDRRMPAVLRLREIAQSRRARARREKLTFWAPAGPVSLPCDIVSPEGAAQGTLVVLAGAQAQPLARTKPPPVSREPEAGDAATLRKIARRIRAGRYDASRRAQSRERARATAARSDARASNGSHEGASRSSAARPSGLPLEPDFLRKLGHELKTPLSAIAAAAEIMRDERFGRLGSARYRGYASDISEAARHALSVIDRMLGAGVGDRERAVEVVEINVNALVRSVVSQMQPLAQRAGLKLTLHLAPRLPPIPADATSMRQILLNLVGNALKFTGAGGTVAVITRTNPDGRTWVTVRDTGAGMSDREIARAVGNARSEPPTRRRKGGGFGIGLALARALAANMGATLVIESRRGEGTAASVVLTTRRGR
jgi:signal transduction histidine kinase